MKNSVVTWLNNLTLQKRIGLTVLIGLLVGLSLFSWLGIQSVNDSVDKILEERLTIARLIANHLDENLEHVLLHVRNYADFNGRFPTEEEFKNVATSLEDRLVESGFSVNNIILIRSNGVVQYVANPSPVGAPLVIRSATANHQKIIEAREKQIPTISNLVSDPSLGTPVVLISAPVLNEAGESIGVLTALVDITQSNIGTFNQPVTAGETGYTEIVDGNGIVLSRTSPASPPERFEQSDHPAKFAMLIDQGQAIVRTCHRCHETGGALVRRKDIIAFAPLSTASWGVAIRQAEEEALAPTLHLKQRLLLLGLVIVAMTSMLVWTMMRGIVRPLKMLTSAAKRVAAGDFRVVIPVKHQNEIGQLGSAFQSMTQELAKSRRELIKSRDELVVRNNELSALNSIAGKVNQSLDLEEVLGNTMQEVLDVTRTTAGCIFLRVKNSHRLRAMGSIGSTGIFKCKQYDSPTAKCACHQVLRNGQTVMANDVSRCTMLTEDVLAKENISSFVSVPLKAKDRTIGIMNIVCSNENPFTEKDFRILDSIAYHIGLAIENSVLFDESKKKEELRGQLLNRAINAQEDERKRIARELHDEYGQLLTLLKIEIETSEDMALPVQSKLREKLRHASALVAEGLEDLRRLTLNLRPYLLDQLGLVAAIRAYAQPYLGDAGIQLEFKTKGLSHRLASHIETALFRTIQEAIHNIVRHAEARNVKIQLEVTTDKITVSIKDDGKGLDVDNLSLSGTRTQPLGILGIQERATLLGGNFNIESLPGQGTCLTVEIPIENLAIEPDIKTR